MKQTFAQRKAFYKERQLLYEQMKQVEQNRVGRINGEEYQSCSFEKANVVFIWFNRKPMIAEYNCKTQKFTVGDQILYLSSPHRKSQRVIGFAYKPW